MVEAAGNGGFFILEMPVLFAEGGATRRQRFSKLPRIAADGFQGPKHQLNMEQTAALLEKDADQVVDNCEDIPQSPDVFRTKIGL